METVYWSNASDWLGSSLQAGEDVIIPKNMKIILDENTPELGTLAVNGTLEFAREDLTLTADNIVVNGAFRVGSAENPFTQKAEIILTGQEADPDVVVADYLDSIQDGSYDHHVTEPIDNKSLIVTGKLELHGNNVTSWTQLNETVKPGETTITLSEEITGWKVGDVIAIAPTDFDAYEVEEVTITDVENQTVTFDQPLQFEHYGKQQTFDNGTTLDMRAEVANLSRNITISGRDEGELETRTADIGPNMEVGYGGHTMYLPRSEIKIDGVEFTRLGISGESARYPVHFHHGGDMEQSYVKNASIHNTFNRGLVIHQTNEVLVEDNVIFDTVGHQYYLEDGVEINNDFYGNLAMLPRETPQDLRVDLDDEIENNNEDALGRDERASAFWITNGANEFVGNHAVAVGHGQGFWFIRPDHNTEDLGISPYDSRKQMPMQTFKDNVAHTIGHDQNGNFNLGYGPEWTGIGLDFTHIRSDWNGAYAGIPNAPVENFTAWKTANMAVQAGGYSSEFINLTVAEARELVHVPQGQNRDNVELINSTFIGETQNNPINRDISEHITDLVSSGGFSGPRLAGTLGGRTIEITNSDIYGADEFASLSTPTTSDSLLSIDEATEFHSENTGPSSAENQSPTASNDSFTITSEQAPFIVNVLANDSDADGDAINLNSFTQPSNGTVTREDNGTSANQSDDKLVYTPDSGFVGSDSFSYTIADVAGETSTATVSVTIENSDEKTELAPVTLTAEQASLDGSSEAQAWGEGVTVSGVNDNGQAASVVYGWNGLSVDSGRYQYQIDYNPTSDTSEQLKIDLNTEVNNVTLELGRMSTSEWQGLNETGTWTAYDANGALVDSGILDPSVATAEVEQNAYTFDLKTSNSFSELAIAATAYGNGQGTDRTDNNSDFNLRGLTYTPIDSSDLDFTAV